jgi:site-specific DNA recombinase
MGTGRGILDTGWSGSKASRPEFDRLMQDAAQREIDVILSGQLDRFGRSLLHCKLAIEGLRAHSVRFIATSQRIDTDESNPASRFLLHILMAAAEFERELIRERGMAGLKRYRGSTRPGKWARKFTANLGRICLLGGLKESSPGNESRNYARRATATGQ